MSFGYHRSPTIFITNNLHDFMCEKTGHNFWGIKEMHPYIDNKEIIEFNEIDNYYRRKQQFCLPQELKEIKKHSKWVRSDKREMPKFKILQISDT